MSSKPKGEVRITHYSDILCIWAFVSQVRMSELRNKFPGQAYIDYRFVTVFGDVESMIGRAWASRGGMSAYNKHVCSVAEKFPHVTVNPDIWNRDVPASSLPAHLMLCAIRDLIARDKLDLACFETVASETRRAFFVDCRNIAKRSVLFDVLAQCEIDTELVERSIQQGDAYAVLASDIQSARALHVETSPTLLFNEDRQRLTGNVGYRIIEANVHELLERSSERYSAWC